MYKKIIKMWPSSIIIIYNNQILKEKCVSKRLIDQAIFMSKPYIEPVCELILTLYYKIEHQNDQKLLFLSIL